MSQLIRRVAKKGFTLIELMIVVAIIGILAAIAIPKFADLITKSKESSAKGSLGSVRGALTIYYSDTEGVWPTVLGELAVGGKYLDQIPEITIPKINTSGTPGHPGLATVSAGAISDAGGWTFFTSSVVINCTHQDTKSSIWSGW